jgi:hypothetical protein
MATKRKIGTAQRANINFHFWKTTWRCLRDKTAPFALNWKEEEKEKLQTDRFLNKASLLPSSTSSCSGISLAGC